MSPNTDYNLLRRLGAVGSLAALTALSVPAQTAPTTADPREDDDTVLLGEFVVSGYRASLEKSLETKREALAIIDVVTAEDVGKFPDINVAESLSHITGISVDHQFGEGEKVSIFGTDPALNRVLINGQTIASGDWGGNPTDTSGRTFNYTLLSPEIIGTMEVYKATEARIDEGSIGGTVIINTRRPLDLNANTFRGSLGYSYNDRSEKGNLRGSVLYSWKNAEKNFGALVALTHDEEDLYRAGIEYWGVANTTQDETTYKIAFGMNSAWFKQERKRDGVQAALQWEPTDALSFTLTTIGIKGVYDNFSQSRYVVPAFWGTLDSYTTSNGFITGGHVTAGEGSAPTVANGQFDTNLRKSTVKTTSINLHTDYRMDDWHVGIDTGTTRATGGKDPEYLFSTMFNESFTFSYSGKDSSLTFDDSSAATDPTAYTTRRVGDQAGGIEYTTTEDKEAYLQLDFDKNVAWGPFKKIRTGAKYTDHINSQDSYGNRIDVTGQVVDLTAFDTHLAPAGLWSGLGTTGDSARMVTPTQESVVAYLLSQTARPWEEKRGQEWYVREQNTAGYVQGDFSVGQVRGNVGVRIVSTDDQSKYWNYDSATATYSKVRKNTSYTKVLPSLNLAYSIKDDLVLRAGIAQVVARPRYSDLAGFFSVDNERLTGSGGNPDLDPYEANNINVALEYYLGKTGIISAELFLRDIDNYVLSVTEDKVLYNTSTGGNSTYSISSPFNAGSAKVKGIALSFQKDIAFGFGISANATFADSDTTAGYNLPYLSKRTYNVIPYYEKGPWSARVSYSWRSEFFTSIGRLNLPLFSDTYSQLDASVSYSFSEKYRLTINAANLLDETYFWYYQTKYAPMGVYKNGRKLSASINIAF